MAAELHRDDIVISKADKRVLPAAEFIVRHLEEDVKLRLRRRALRHGHSMEEEVRHVLRDAVKLVGHWQRPKKYSRLVRHGHLPE